MSSTDPLEASIRIRDGKKWKKRFCVLQSAASAGSAPDAALLSVYKNVKFSRKPGPKRRVYRIEGFYGLESGFHLDKESRTLAIICQTSITVLAFDSDPTLRVWELWFRSFFGHGCQFSVYVLETPLVLSALRNINARLHLRDGRFCLVVDSPPRIVMELTFREIRRFGAFENKFCIEAGTRTGSLAGIYIFRSGHRDQMSFTFRLAAQGELHQYLSSNNCSNDRVDSADTNVLYGSVQSASNGSVSGRPLPPTDIASGSASHTERKLPFRSASAKGSASLSLTSGHSNGNRGDSQLLDRLDALEHGTGDSKEVPRPARRTASEKLVKLRLQPEPTGPTQADAASPKTNYVNQNYLKSLDYYYYNVEHVVSVSAPEHDLTAAIGASTTDKKLMPSYTAMGPRRSVYERMDSSTGENENGAAKDMADDDAGSVSSGVFVKPFEPLILRKEQSGTLSWVASAPNGRSGRKFSLPATLMTERPAISLQYVRRFSLEEERHARSESPLSSISVGGGLAAMFRSSGGLAKSILRNGSIKARTFLDNFVRRTSLRKGSTRSKMGADEERNGSRESRAFSEPPAAPVLDIERLEAPTIIDQGLMKASRSSLDLDEVVYDVASTQNLPPAVLKRIGLKPLVPEISGPTATSSTVKLPIGPKDSYGTDSTRSSDSTNGAAPPDRQFDGVFDSVSVGSDNSDSDSVFLGRAVRKKPIVKAASENSKTPGKAKNSKISNASTPLVRTSTPVSSLEPHRLSINAQRRLRQDVTKPLSGSYSRYDGDGSCDSPLLSPSILVPLARTSTAANKHSTIPNRYNQTYTRFEIGGRHSKNSKWQTTSGHSQRSQDAVSPLSAITAHSPSPPAEPAPPPPSDDTAPIRRSLLSTLPRSALPRLEGHVFKFPPPTPLNYAMLAAQSDKLPVSPMSEGGSCQTPTNLPATRQEISENGVEYAKIDQVATQAARKVVTSRREEARNRWSSSHALSNPSEAENHRQENSEQSTASTSFKFRRPFSLKRSLIRRRTSMASLAGL